MKLLNETDLRLEFKMSTGKYPNENFSTTAMHDDVELEVFVDVDLDENKYINFLEEQLLQYKNAELVIEQANIEANTIVREEKEKCNGCVNCDCDE